ncbi:MAG: sulfite exporter TauE/SafE family protein [Sporomusaceae bacterium]|jgi:uncharacterized membrane protein YfcA|nr:sulfite exporter TauE/SafE family protein [Sporomusaceae bacterium]
MNENFKFTLAGFLGGTMAGLLGIGGGIIFIPIMVSYFKMSQHNAQATSALTIIPTALASMFIYASHGNMDAEISLYIILGSVVGASITARMMKKIPEVKLKKAFSIFLILVGARMVLM